MCTCLYIHAAYVSVHMACKQAGRKFLAKVYNKLETNVHSGLDKASGKSLEKETRRTGLLELACQAQAAAIPTLL